jgi:adenylate cyclase class 2
MFEIEAKYRVDDFSKLKDLYDFRKITHEQDVYYQHPIRNFLETNEWLRIRQIDKTYFLCYKSKEEEGDIKTRKEIEFCTSKDHHEILRLLGFTKLTKVEKYRCSAIIKNIDMLCAKDYQVSVTLDDVIGIGKFVEIEVVSTHKEDFSKTINEIALFMNLKEIEPLGYAEMSLK